MSGGKYRNKKIEVDGILFDSKKESRRWIELRILEKAGEISELSRQKSYTLLPSQKLNGKVVERSVVYKADFAYKTKDGKYVVEDVKSPATKTRAYILKRKMLLYFYGIKIDEI